MFRFRKPRVRFFVMISICVDHERSYVIESNENAMNRNWRNQKANPALKTKMGNNQKSQIDKIQ